MGSLVGVAYSSRSWLTLTVSKGSHSYFISHRGTQKQAAVFDVQILVGIAGDTPILYRTYRVGQCPPEGAR